MITVVSLRTPASSLSIGHTENPPNIIDLGNSDFPNIELTAPYRGIVYPSLQEMFVIDATLVTLSSTWFSNYVIYFIRVILL